MLTIFHLLQKLANIIFFMNMELPVGDIVIDHSIFPFIKFRPFTKQNHFSKFAILHDYITSINLDL